ncbi:hypothetical protein Bbelb_337680 [Branchiostoma belcheri]|nr:hypothetical protein Bbelb_337680 [Branchiostoma belcheri]
MSAGGGRVQISVLETRRKFMAAVYLGAALPPPAILCSYDLAGSSLTEMNCDMTRLLVPSIIPRGSLSRLSTNGRAQFLMRKVIRRRGTGIQIHKADRLLVGRLSPPIIHLSVCALRRRDGNLDPSEIRPDGAYLRICSGSEYPPAQGGLMESGYALPIDSWLTGTNASPMHTLLHSGSASRLSELGEEQAG